MKKLIKAAIAYKATIPTDAVVLHEHLLEKQFTECTETQLRSAGFVPPNDEGPRLVTFFPGGLAFRVRIDDKVIPAAALAAEVEKRVAAVKQSTGRKVGKKERAEIKEQTLADLCRRALVKTTASVTCFYEIESRSLLVATASQSIADVCTTLLVQAVGSVKTETINVSDVKHGLTTRLKTWLDDEEGFGDFQPCDDVALQAEGRKITVKMSSLQQAHKGLTEALTAGFAVTSIGFHYDGMDFRVTGDFHLKGITFAESDIPEDDESTWEADAAIQVKKVNGIINELAALLSYKDAVAVEGGAQ